MDETCSENPQQLGYAADLKICSICLESAVFCVFFTVVSEWGLLNPHLLTLYCTLLQNFNADSAIEIPQHIRHV